MDSVEYWKKKETFTAFISCNQLIVKEIPSMQNWDNGHLLGCGGQSWSK